MNPDLANEQALALYKTGQLEAAIKLLDSVLAEKPAALASQVLKGRLLQTSHNFEGALDCFNRALVMRPDMPDVLNDQGALLNLLGQPATALRSFDRALAAMPRNAVILYNRGNALRALKREPEAVASYDRAIEADPGLVQAWNNRGAALSDLKRHRDAVESFDRALAIHAGFVDTWTNRANALSHLGRHDEALRSYDKALSLDAGFAAAWDNRGALLRDMKLFDAALASHERALAIKPGERAFWTNRGLVLRDMKRAPDAIASFSKALEIDPDHAESLSIRGMLHWVEARDYDAATRDLERAVQIDPDCPYAMGWLFLVRQYGGDWRDYDAHVKAVDAGVRSGKPVVDPFFYQAISHSPADLMACSIQHARERFPAAAPSPKPVCRAGKIRIGYLSGEFREQATAHLMAGVYEQHDKSRFEIVAFDNGFDDHSPMRERLVVAFDKFVDITPLSDKAAAHAIAAEGIDILVNLNGYFGDYRMGVFAQRPAAIQVNYLGFPATLGAPYMDYIIADEIVIPAQERRFYTEQVAYLPPSYQANDSRRPVVGNSPSRASCGLPPDGFVFCNFNAGYKLTPASFSSWMRILEQVPGSVLWLLEGDPHFSHNVRREAEARGVSGDRIILAPFLPLASHLARLSLADLFLDGLPYNAHTTAADALWAGVPVLTQKGTTFPGRVGASLLQAAGLPELITTSETDYETLALSLSQDRERLSVYRKALTQKQRSPLFQTAHYCRNLESAYAQMVETARRGEPPRSFSVTPFKS